MLPEVLAIHVHIGNLKCTFEKHVEALFLRVCRANGEVNSVPRIAKRGDRVRVGGDRIPGMRTETVDQAESSNAVASAPVNVLLPMNFQPSASCVFVRSLAGTSTGVGPPPVDGGPPLAPAALAPPAVVPAPPASCGAPLAPIGAMPPPLLPVPPLSPPPFASTEPDRPALPADAVMSPLLPLEPFEPQAAVRLTNVQQTNDRSDRGAQIDDTSERSGTLTTEPAIMHSQYSNKTA